MSVRTRTALVSATAVALALLVSGCGEPAGTPSAREGTGRAGGRPA
ncbi:hypothetical protein [Streptomyces tritici]